MYQCIITGTRIRLERRIMDKTPKCSECDHRVNNTCTKLRYSDGKPYVIGSISAFDGSYGNRLAIKTSPRWCPLKERIKNDKC